MQGIKVGRRLIWSKKEYCRAFWPILPAIHWYPFTSRSRGPHKRGGNENGPFLASKRMGLIEGGAFLAPVKGVGSKACAQGPWPDLKPDKFLLFIFLQRLWLHQINPGTSQAYLQTWEDSSQRCSHTHILDSETDCGKVDANKSSLACHQSAVTGSCLGTWKIQLHFENYNKGSRSVNQS